MRFDGKKIVKAVQFVKKLRGASQPVLVQGSDGMFYVLKFGNNPQGPNVAFNESLGSEVLACCDVPVPDWSPVEITADFLDRNPDCRMSIDDRPLRPAEGMCFGSRFLGLPGSPLCEILPGSSFCRIGNRLDFWKIWVLDVLAEHADNRQALFLRDESGLMNACFIDHGHLFGGPRGTENPGFLTPRYLDPRIYAPVAVEECDHVMNCLRAIDRGALEQVSRSLPESWVTLAATARFERFLDRVADQSLLKEIAFMVLDGMRRTRDDLDRSRTKPVLRDSALVWRNQMQGAC